MNSVYSSGQNNRENFTKHKLALDGTWLTRRELILNIFCGQNNARDTTFFLQRHECTDVKARQYQNISKF